jgi:hypothetical protein
MLAAARDRRINLRDFGNGRELGVTLDETCDLDTVRQRARSLRGRSLGCDRSMRFVDDATGVPDAFARTSEFLTHPVFHRYHGEHALLRYMHALQSRDLSLTTSMIPLGSCTMKLNATSEMLAVTLARVWCHSSLRAGRSAARVCRAVSRPRTLARRDHRLRRRVVAAQRRLAGRIRGLAGHSRGITTAATDASRCLSHPRLGAWHQPRERGDGRLARGAGACDDGQHRPRRSREEGDEHKDRSPR